ncbi:methyltransferase domain-containing protein [uncultured Clostridium sp.]|uniref:MerR family transcriptional regulator n=1 Tax=uncultured Clostridium sp. TaxID=59620 RepID=UPI0025F15A96|nr:methyltransferase domain-containing protein [uncultured Clostridium sp.]
MKIGEFAKRSGVTVKTLLHYDKIGLLKPAEKTESGYRLYCEEDFLKLQQITTLKFIGLSLSEIKNVLSESGENLENMISIQKKALEQKKKHIEEVISVFNKAERSAKETGFLDAGNLIDIIKITNMERSVKEQYKNDKNLKLRSNLHSYNINKIDWDKWCFDNMEFPTEGRVLELGCGTGKFWKKNKGRIKEGLNICVSDFSRSMLKSAEENLKEVNHDFTFKEINAECIPYDDCTFDVVIAQHMIYFIPDIDKALKEIKRVLVLGGKFYVTANSKTSMAELNELIENFDAESGLNSNGYSTRFELENGKEILKKYFSRIDVDILNGRIIVDDPEPVVSYKASTIQGNRVLVGEKRKEFKNYLKKYIKDNNNISITTKTCIFKCEK